MATIFPSNMAIVVGGGLAGMSAANTILENNGKVVLVDKSAFCGGNSTKATSGINGSDTKTQRNLQINDSIELFTKDTLKGGAKKPEIAQVLCGNSGPDVDWLMDNFNLDLSLVARLGGHSVPRTHRGKERFPGMTITYALIQMLERIAEKTDKARIITKARAKTLLRNDSGGVIGLVYEKAGMDFQEYGPVILATGGFGADFTSNSLLAQYRPDLMHLPTTNGEHCTGDGIKMGEAIGAKSVDLEWVQVHPTGLVKPDDPDAKIKFLAAEALRGVGGLVFDANGKRFANELGRRDYVTGEMWKNKPPFRLVLNKQASDEIIWHCKHYTGRGVMKYYATGADLAKDMGVPVATLEQEHEAHYQAAMKTKSDPDNGPYPAYPDGKSWDDASGKTKAGKKFYHNIIQGSQVKDQEFYVAIITPVIHYCMGGLEIDKDSAVLNEKGVAIPGLYCAGEVAGGVHGNNRLGGNSLLDCVVFGRVAAKACAKYMLGDDAIFKPLIELSCGGLTGEVESSKLAGGSYEDNMNETSKAAGGAGAAPAAKAAKKKSGGGGGFTMEEVAKHNKKGDCWVVLDGRVLNVSKFLPDHPGGELAILTFAGKDATEEFNMIHPPDVVGKYAPDAIIGELGAGGAGGDDESESEEEEADAGDGYSLAEIAKHNTKADCWVAINGMCLNVTKFLPEHPGGELAILTFAGKDASEEFNMIHPPGVIEKYAPEAIIGKVGTGAAKKKSVKAKKSAPAPAARTDKGDRIANIHSWGSGRYESLDDCAFTHPTAYIGAAWYLAIAVLWEICATIFSAKNIKTGSDRVGLTRSAILLILFIVIHAVGNLHVFLGPDDFNGYGYFYVRLYWTGFGFPANIVEEYILLSVLLHVFVGLKRTWDIKLRAQPAGKPKRSIGETIKLLNLALSGLMLLCFMTIHLFQFRFGNTSLYYLRPPTYLINFWGILSLNLFWTTDETVAPVGVRDIYKLEYDVFKNSVEDGGQPTFWFYFYIFSVCVFVTHACLGWNNVIGVLGVPKQHKTVVSKVGYGIFIVMGLIYISFPLYVAFTDAFVGNEVALQH